MEIELDVPAAITGKPIKIKVSAITDGGGEDAYWVADYWDYTDDAYHAPEETAAIDKWLEADDFEAVNAAVIKALEA